MAVDRGGLQYTIRIEDKFSGPLGKFTAEIRAAQRALASLGSNAAELRSTAAAIRTITAESRRTARESRRAAEEETIRQRIRRIAAERERRARLEQAIAQRRAAIATRQEVRQARRLATARQKQVVADRAVTRVVNNRTAAQDKLNAARRRGVRLSLDERQRLGVITDQERVLLRLQKQRAALAAVAGSARIRQLTAENEANRRRIAADKEAATQEILRAQGRTRTGALAPAVERVSRAERARIAVLKRLRAGLRATGQEANRVSFTFRRLFGILAAFAAARAIFRAFTQLTREIVRFNAAIEQAELGIASLFLAVGDVRDIFGRQVTAAQGLEIAIGESRKQMDLLRRDALKTAGTFEDLLDAFQVAVAPGLQAGLDIDEIRKFTVDISRAATAIGLQQNQLAEEIRSILSGTIQARTTRIAVALGITNEDIRNAKEAGVLIEFLNERFSAFGEAGEKALETFNALFTNLKGAIQLVLAAGGLEFFNSIKDILAELFELITSQDPITKILSPDPRAVAIVKEFATGLKDAIGVANGLRNALSFEDVATAAKGIGAALVAVGTILAGIVQGVIQGFTLLVNLANKVSNAIKGLSGDIINTDNLREAVALVATFASLSIGVTAVTGLMTALWTATVVAIGAINVGLKAIQFTLKGIRLVMIGIGIIAAFINAPITVVVAALLFVTSLLVLGLSLLKDWFEEISGLEIGFVNFIRLLSRVLIGRVRQAATQTIAVFKFVFATLKKVAFTAIQSIVETVVNQLSSILDIVGKFNKSAKELANTIRGIGSGVSAAAGAEADKAAEALEEASAAFFKAKQDFIDSAGQDAIDLSTGGADEDFAGDLLGGLKEQFDDLFKSIIPDLTGLFGNIDVGLADATNEALTLSEAFDSVLGIITESRKGLSTQTDLLKKLTDGARKAADALRIGLDVIGLSNTSLSIRTSILKSHNKLLKEQQFLDREQGEVRKSLADTELSLQRIRTRAAKARTSLEKEFVRLNTVNFGRIAFAEKIVFDARAKQSKAQIALIVARNQGTADEINAAEVLLSSETRRVDLAEKGREDTRQAAETINLLSLISSERQAELIELIREEELLRGQQVIDTERLAQIARDRIQLERQLQLILARQIRLLAEQGKFQAILSGQRSDLEQFRLLSALREREDLNNAETRVRAARAELLTLSGLTDLAQQDRARNFAAKEADVIRQALVVQKLSSELAATPVGSEGREDLEVQFKAQVAAVNALIKERAALRVANASATEIERLELLRLIAALDDETRKLEQPISFGFTRGLQDFILEAQDVFTTFKGIVTGAFESLGDTLGSALTNAIAGVDQNVREIFANLLKDIATQIIQMLIRLAIAKAALGLGFGFAKGGEVGRADGGPIPRAQGLADGGFSGPVPNMPAPRIARPKGLDPRDTVPIWAQKGEWMMRLKAVRYYGADLMNAMNSMLINPSALRAIAGIGSTAGAVRRVTRGAATGGEIGQATDSIPTQQQPEQAQGPATAILIGSEDSMQQMLTGGRNAMLDFLRANRDEFAGSERPTL